MQGNDTEARVRLPLTSKTSGMARRASVEGSGTVSAPSRRTASKKLSEDVIVMSAYSGPQRRSHFPLRRTCYQAAEENSYQHHFGAPMDLNNLV